MVTHVSDAFSVIPECKTRQVMPSTSAIEYTIHAFGFVSGVPKSSWYDVANPTARRIVYDDGPNDFMFAAVGNNWTELNDVPDEEEPVAESTQKKKRQTWARINPIRHARNLIRWVF